MFVTLSVWKKYTVVHILTKDAKKKCTEQITLFVQTLNKSFKHNSPTRIECKRAQRAHKTNAKYIIQNNARRLLGMKINLER